MLFRSVKTVLDNHNITDFGGHQEDARTGIQGVAQSMFVYPLIKAVQELSAQVTALQAEVETLKGA